MGRFATTVPLYQEFRPPYPSEFFRTVSERLGFTHQHQLIDLGTGPGLLALGFAPYVGRIVGVDPEPAMVAAARENAARQGKRFTLIEGKAETLPVEIGRFDVVTIGRALHWMEREAVAALFDRLVTPDGVIVVCSSRSATDGRNAWLDTYDEARRSWSGSEAGGRHRGALAAALEGTRFQEIDEINVETSQEISAAGLAQRVLTYSSSSPAILGDKADAMLRDVEARLMPFSHQGMLSEIVIATAKVVC
ncbi:MAG TPA: class I SAM-dependent methyltransferase [Alphaproteobacteria bacterium]|nr:class I SAM-dependent methyltransferase [Alphaproteobacteria bacterium]